MRPRGPGNEDGQRQKELKIGKSFVSSYHRGRQCHASLEMRRIACLLRISLLQKWDRELQFPYLKHCDCHC